MRPSISPAELIERLKQPDAVRDLLTKYHEEDIAELILELELDQAVALVRNLPEDFGAAVLERLDEETRVQIFRHLHVEEAANLLVEMEPDDRANAVQEIGGELQQTLIAEVEKVDSEAADEIRELSAYPTDTAGGMMTTAFVGLEPESKIWQAIEEVRRLSRENEVESAYYVYALAFGGQLVGVASLRQLILADPSQSLADIMTENVVRVGDYDDQQVVATTIAKYDFSAVPVVDRNGRMVGVVTVDDVVDVVIEEATEDAHKMGAVSPMENRYFETPFLLYFRSRVSWLVVLFVGGFLTASVMETFQHQLETVVSLMVFLPLIISTGGNAGSQSASLMIRALATHEVEPEEWLKVLGRELTVGIALGTVVGLLGLMRVLFFGPAWLPALAITVGISVVLVVTVGSVVGAVLPLFIFRLGMDPAVSSTPFIATLSDVVGLLIYFSVASQVFGLH